MKNERSNPLEELKTLRKLEEDMLGHIEKVSRVHSIPKTKSIIAKSKITDAVQIMIGTRNTERNKQFNPKCKENLSRLIDEMGSGRTVILLLAKEDGSGAMEMITGKEYKFA